MLQTSAGAMYKILRGEPLHPFRFVRDHAATTRLRWRKRLHRATRRNPRTIPLFVLGNQRSGTTMILHQLNLHLDTDVYHEDSRIMREWLIKDLDVIRKVVDDSRARVVVMKPLEDSHRVLEFLDAFENSRVIWTFRDYRDVINSSLKHDWGVQLKTYVSKIAAGEYFRYSEPLNLTEKNATLVRKYFSPSMHENDCVALIWYLRNTIFFDMELGGRSDVLPVNYEKLTLEPVLEFGKIAAFIGIDIDESILQGIHSRSIKKNPEPVLNPEIKKLCDRMLKDLTDVYEDAQTEDDEPVIPESRMAVC